MQRPRPLTLFWKLIIALAAAVGVGTCVGLGFIYSHFFIVDFGTVRVLERPATERDMPAANRAADGEARIDSARFLATYESTTYYVAKGSTDSSFCILGKGSYSDDYWELCRKMGDGRDPVVQVSGPDGRNVVLVPDQFNHRELEADGWVTIHDNVMIQPLAPCTTPLVC